MYGNDNTTKNYDTPYGASTADTVSRTADAVANAAGDLKATAADSARQIGDAAAREAQRFGEMARDWFSRNSRSARDLAVTAKDQAAEYGDRAQAYVRDEPLKSVLIAAGVGAVVAGLLVSGRRNTRY